MSQENVEIVRAVIDAWNSGEFEALVPYMAEGIEWLEVGGLHETPAGGEVRGRDNVQSGFESLSEAWQSYRLEPEEVREAGQDRIFAVLREAARGRASGLEVSGRWGYVVTLQDRKLTRVEAYRDPEEAREAAGLSE
jgi:ketosteroid isomerase-like protein